MADSKITITGSAEGVLKELKKVQKENDNLVKKLEKQKAASKEAAQAAKERYKKEKEEIREAAKLEREKGDQAKRIFEQTRTPMEKYRMEQKKLNQLLKEGKIDQTTFNRAMRQNHDNLKMQSKAYREQIQLEKERRAQAKQTYEETRTPLEKYNRQQERLNVLLNTGKIDQTTYQRAMKKNNETFKSATATSGGFARSLQGIALQYIGVAAAARAVTSELEKQERLKQKARDANLTAEEGLQRARANFAPDDTITRATLDSSIKKAAAEVGVPVAEFGTAFGDVESAKGALSNAQAIEVTKSAFLAAPNRELGAARYLGQAAGDFLKLGESQDPRAVLGFLKQAQIAARATDTASFAENAFPAVQAGTQAGATIEEATEIFATVNRLVGDPQARISSTATGKLIGRLREFEPVKDKRTPLEKLRAIQADPKLQEQFLAEPGFEEKARPAIRSLITGDARARTELADTQKKIGSLLPASDAANIKAFDETIAFQQGRGTLTGDLAGQKRQAASNVETANLSNRERAIIGQANAILKETLSSVNLRNIEAIPGTGIPSIFSFDAIQEFALNSAAQTTTDPRRAIGFATRQLQELSSADSPRRLENDAERQLVKDQLKVLQQLSQTLSNIEASNQRAANAAERNANPADPANRLDRDSK